MNNRNCAYGLMYFLTTQYPPTQFAFHFGFTKYVCKKSIFNPCILRLIGSFGICECPGIFFVKGI